MMKKPTVKIKRDDENPNKGHRQRVRDRFVKGGLDVFADHEVLELLLYYAIPQKDTNKIAHRIHKEFGSLHAVFEARPKQIMARANVTENTAILLSLMSQIAVRYQSNKYNKKITFQNSQQMARYAIIPFINQTEECFYMMCLDNAFNLLGFEQLESGTIDKVELHPRRILDYALMNKASYVVLVHNHPSGSDKISQADIVATLSIMHQLSPFNIRVLDHIIALNDREYVSFAEQGLSQFATLEALNSLSEEKANEAKKLAMDRLRVQKRNN